MPEATRDYLYTTKAEVEALKSECRELGIPKDVVRFDAKAKAHYLDHDRLTQDVDLGKLDRFRSQEAQEAWKVDREQNAKLDDKARTTAAEKAGKSREYDEDRFIYPALSQKDELKQLEAANDAKVIYVGSQKAYYVQEGDIEPFRQFQGKEAEDRFRTEFEERQAKQEASKERAREVADAKAHGSRGESFAAKYVALGMLMSAEKDKDGNPQPKHDAQKAEIAGAGTEELQKVYYVSVRKSDQLRQQEVEIRAKAAGMEPSEFAKLDLNTQKEKARDGEGRLAGLPAGEFATLQSLRRGIDAIGNELVGRGVFQSRDRSQAKGQEQGSELNSAAEKMTAKTASKEAAKTTQKDAKTEAKSTAPAKKATAKKTLKGQEGDAEAKPTAAQTAAKQRVARKRNKGAGK